MENRAEFGRGRGDLARGDEDGCCFGVPGHDPAEQQEDTSSNSSAIALGSILQAPVKELDVNSPLHGEMATINSKRTRALASISKAPASGKLYKLPLVMALPALPCVVELLLGDRP